MYVIYWRCEANIVDLRQFKDMDELKEWLFNQLKLEPVVLIGIYNGDTKIIKVEKDYFKFVEYFEKSKNDRETLYRFVKSLD